MNLADLKRLFVQSGCTELYAKLLADNDNSKNQVYFGPGYNALNIFPAEDIVADRTPKEPTFKAKLRFSWLLENGQTARAPSAQLILYPAYPEVRFSGFLKGCDSPPSALMTVRRAGRVLFLGVTASREVLGYVVDLRSQIAEQLKTERGLTQEGVFQKLRLPGRLDDVASKKKLLADLRAIALKGWIASKQLDQRGEISPCNAPQCGGFTLEAELGIPKNSSAEPDYLGWELKQHAVANFDRPATSAPITLMTPEPNGGVYRSEGPEAFVHRFGYPDRLGRPDRMNFGGIHKVGVRHALTGLTLKLSGFDSIQGKIVDENGALMLVDDDGRVAASWNFAGLLAHWSRKHRKAVYVPSKSRQAATRQYSYGSKIRLALDTDPLKLLKGFSGGFVFYDPGIKVENVSTNPKVKRRSQFRIASKSISELYEDVSLVDLLTDG
jgi:hypothetical protein